jgi:N-methylhydantoinase A/oxoprolinase/acetone carboxylase beta subunit
VLLFFPLFLVYTETHRYSFSMPDVHSIGLGGGSRIHVQDGGIVSVGPDSVGNRVRVQAFSSFISA